jgi:hypothetical protein
MNILCIDFFCLQRNAQKNVALRWYTPQAQSPFWLRKPASEHAHTRLLPRLSWSWIALLPTDAHRKSVTFIQLCYFHFSPVYWLFLVNGELGCKRKCPWSVLSYRPSIWLEGLRKATMNVKLFNLSAVNWTRDLPNKKHRWECFDTPIDSFLGFRIAKQLQADTMFHALPVTPPPNRKLRYSVASSQRSIFWSQWKLRFIWWHYAVGDFNYNWILSCELPLITAKC